VRPQGSKAVLFNKPGGVPLADSQSRLTCVSPLKSFKRAETEQLNHLQHGGSYVYLL
jgi:hypothetical protein